MADVGLAGANRNYLINQQLQADPVTTTTVSSTAEPSVQTVSEEVTTKAPADDYAAKSKANTAVGVGNKSTSTAGLHMASGVSATHAMSAADKTKAVGDDKPTVTQQSASQLATWMDMDKSMKVSAYSNSMNNGLASQGGYYAQALSTATKQKAEIDKNIAKLQAQDPVDQSQIDQLQQLGQVADNMITLYSNLKGATAASGTKRTEQNAQFMNDIVALQNSIGQLDPALIGEDTYNAMLKSVGDLTEVAFGFASIQTNENTGTPSRLLGAFVMQTFRRLQQIEGGQRKRSTETADITGALKTYENDAKDCCQFMISFSNIRQKVIKEGITDPEVVKGMLLDATKGAPGLKSSIDQFAVSYAKLAEASIHSAAAKENLAEAQEYLEKSAAELDAAQDNLATAAGYIQAGQICQTSQADKLGVKEALKQQTGLDAKTMHQYATNLKDEAGQHIENYYHYQQQGVEYADLSQAEALTAGACLNVAEASINVVESGPQGKYFKAETGRVQGEIAKSRSELEATYADAQDVKDTFSKFDSLALTLTTDMKNIEQGLNELDANISLTDLVDKTAEMTSKTVDAAYARVTDDINAYVQNNKVKVSADFKQFIKDPNGYLEKHPDNAGNIREEFSELFEDHPALAEQVAKDMNSIKADFQKSRRELEAKLIKAGKDPKSEPLSTQLDSMESSVVNGLLEKNQFLFGALLESSSSKTSAAKEMINWVGAVQKNMTSHMISDPSIRQSCIDSFEVLINSEAGKPYKANIDARAKEYGKPVETESLSVYMSDVGKTQNMNVYIFKKGGKFYALDPLTNNLYNGATKTEAMRDLANHYDHVNGEVSFLNDSGKVEKYNVSRPANTIYNDIAFSCLGVVGSLLLVVPEPTMATKVAGVGCISASAGYFINKGATAIIEQVRVDNFDLSRQESRDALIDVVSGIFAVAGPIAEGSATAVRASTMLNTASRMTRLGKVIKVSGTGVSIVGTGNTTSDAFGAINEAVNNNALSDSEKREIVITQILNLIPAIVGAAI